MRIQKNAPDKPGPEPGLSGGALQVFKEATLHVQLEKRVAAAPDPLWTIFVNHHHEPSVHPHRLGSCTGCAMGVKTGLDGLAFVSQLCEVG